MERRKERIAGLNLEMSRMFTLILPLTSFPVVFVTPSPSCRVTLKSETLPRSLGNLVVPQVILSEHETKPKKKIKKSDLFLRRTDIKKAVAL